MSSSEHKIGDIAESTSTDEKFRWNGVDWVSLGPPQPVLRPCGWTTDWKTDLSVWRYGVNEKDDCQGWLGAHSFNPSPLTVTLADFVEKFGRQPCAVPPPQVVSTRVRQSTPPPSPPTKRVRKN